MDYYDRGFDPEKATELREELNRLTSAFDEMQSDMMRSNDRLMRSGQNILGGADAENDLFRSADQELQALGSRIDHEISQAIEQFENRSKSPQESRAKSTYGAEYPQELLDAFAQANEASLTSDAAISEAFAALAAKREQAGCGKTMLKGGAV